MCSLKQVVHLIQPLLIIFFVIFVVNLINHQYVQHSHSDSSVHYIHQHSNPNSYKDNSNHLNQSFNAHSDAHSQIKHHHHLPTCINKPLTQYPDQYPDHDVNIQHLHHHLQIQMQDLNIFQPQTHHLQILTQHLNTFK